MDHLRQLDLQAVYSPQPLLMCGSAPDGAELYKLVDFTTRTVRDIRVETTELRARQRSMIYQHLAGNIPPYGMRELEPLVSYFLDPHTFVETMDGDILVSMKQAPYVRRLRLDGAPSPTWPAPADIDFNAVLGSTNCLVGPTAVGVGVTSGSDRLRRYLDPAQEIDCRLATLDPATGTVTERGALPRFVIDSFHELNYSSAGFYVGVDMNLSVDTGPDGKVAGFTDGVLDVPAYCADNHFPIANFCVVPETEDGGLGKATVHAPTVPCAAHVDFDLRDPTTFYISCHYISKWQRQVVIHGPGRLEKYRYRDGEVERCGSFSEPEFLRITSQVPYLMDGRHYLAVTGYPHLLYILDTETMTAVHRIRLFDTEPVSAPLACPKNGAVPLYLAVTADSRYAFLTGATTLYVVDLREGRCVDRAQFCDPGTFVASAHTGLLGQPARAVA